MFTFALACFATVFLIYLYRWVKDVIKLLILIAWTLLSAIMGLMLYAVVLAIRAATWLMQPIPRSR